MDCPENCDNGVPFSPDWLSYSQLYQQYLIYCALATAAGSIPVPPIGENVAFVFEGDSLTAQTGLLSEDRWNTILLEDARYSGVTSSYNVAANGNVLADIVSQYATEVLPHAPATQGTSKTYLTVWIGTNDIFLGNVVLATVAAYLASLEAYWQQALDDGFKVVAFTILPRGEFTPTQEICRRALNQAIRNSSYFKDNNGDIRLYDVSVLLPDYSSVFYLDGTHPSEFGNQRIASGIANLLYSLDQFDPVNGGIAENPFAQIVAGEAYLAGSGLYPYFPGGPKITNAGPPVDPASGIAFDGFPTGGDIWIFPAFGNSLYFQFRPLPGVNSFLATDTGTLALAPIGMQVLTASSTGVTIATNNTGGTSIAKLATGLATMAGGTVVVPDPFVTAGSVIIPSPNFAPAGMVYADVVNIIPGVSFQIDSTNATDAGQISWQRIVL